KTDQRRHGTIAPRERAHRLDAVLVLASRLEGSPDHAVQPLDGDALEVRAVPHVAEQNEPDRHQKEAGHGCHSGSSVRWNIPAGNVTPCSRISSAMRGITPVAVKYPTTLRPCRPRRRNTKRSCISGVLPSSPVISATDSMRRTPSSNRCTWT